MKYRRTNTTKLKMKNPLLLGMVRTRKTETLARMNVCCFNLLWLALLPFVFLLFFYFAFAKFGFDSIRFDLALLCFAFGLLCSFVLFCLPVFVFRRFATSHPEHSRHEENHTNQLTKSKLWVDSQLRIQNSEDQEKAMTPTNKSETLCRCATWHPEPPIPDINNNTNLQQRHLPFICNFASRTFETRRNH